MRALGLAIAAGVIIGAGCLSASKAQHTAPVPSTTSGWDSGGRGAIIGAITDRNGRVAYKANVFVHSLEGGEHVLTDQPGWLNVDSTGTFAFERLTPGGYLVVARLIGYRMCQVTTSVTAGVADTIRMKLDTMSVVFDGHPDTLPMPRDYCVLGTR